MALVDAFASSAPDRSQAHPYAIGGERTLRAAATVAACVGACLPIIVSTLRALSAGAVPNGDRAMIAIRSYDVFTSNTPLTGQFSAITVVTRVATHSLGPMLYWLLAVPSRIGPPAMNLTMGIVNCACVAGCVLIARRRGGQTLMFAVATALALMLLSLGTEVYHDIFNASAGVLPLTLLISMCWSLGCGDYRLLPAAVVVASFVAQAEMTFLGPAVLLVVVGCLALAFTLDRVRRGCPWEGMRGAKLRGDRAPRLWKWTLASAVLLVVCWAPVAIQEAISHPGNLTLVGRAALKHKRVLGPADGWHAVVHAVGVPPWWLTVPKDTFFERLTDVTTVPSTFSQVTAMAILAAILAVTVFSVVRRRLDVALAGIFALGLCLALGSVAGENPKNHLLALSVGYTMWWGSPAGMWAWLTLACGAVALLARRGLALGDPARRVSAVIGVCARSCRRSSTGFPPGSAKCGSPGRTAGARSTSRARSRTNFAVAGSARCSIAHTSVSGPSTSPWPGGDIRRFGSGTAASGCDARISWAAFATRRTQAAQSRSRTCPPDSAEPESCGYELFAPSNGRNYEAALAR